MEKAREAGRGRWRHNSSGGVGRLPRSAQASADLYWAWRLCLRASTSHPACCARLRRPFDRAIVALPLDLVPARVTPSLTSSYGGLSARS